MVYHIEDIIRDVRVCLDQNETGEALLQTGDIDTLSLDEIIKSKIEEGVRRVEETAPLAQLEGGHSIGKNIYWEDNERGCVLLPDDFMRLTSFKMSDWERRVYETITPESVQYTFQRSRNKGLRGNPQKPVVAIVQRGIGQVLEFYSCKDNSAYITEGTYIPLPKIDNYGGIDISERCYDKVVYMISALTILTYGETERAKSFMELAISN